MTFTELTDAELRLLPMDQRAQYWAGRYFHTKEQLDEARRELDILRLQQRRIRDILGTAQ